MYLPVCDNRGGEIDDHSQYNYYYINYYLKHVPYVTDDSCQNKKVIFTQYQHMTCMTEDLTLNVKRVDNNSRRNVLFFFFEK